MERKRMKIACAVLVTFCLILLATVSLAEEVTVVGTVTEEGLLEAADGRVMEVLDTEEGAELLGQAGKKVEVTGVVAEDGDTITIEVTNFTIVEE